jgi:hypothetical protein
MEEEPTIDDSTDDLAGADDSSVNDVFAEFNGDAGTAEASSNISSESEEPVTELSTETAGAIET